MKDVREVSLLAVELVSREGGQCSRPQLVRKMIFHLGDEGNSTLAEEGISQAIDDGYLWDADSDNLRIV